MAAKKTLKQEPIASVRTTGRKALGTRNGTLADWREGSNIGGRVSGRHGYTIRDGR
jgi:hypothetical protein